MICVESSAIEVIVFVIRGEGEWCGNFDVSEWYLAGPFHLNSSQ